VEKFRLEEDHRAMGVEEEIALTIKTEDKINVI